jgi:hypothetical protein
MSNAVISTINMTGSYKTWETFHDPVSTLEVRSGPMRDVSDCTVLRPETNSCKGFIEYCRNSTEIHCLHQHGFITVYTALVLTAFWAFNTGDLETNHILQKPLEEFQLRV